MGPNNKYIFIMRSNKTIGKLMPLYALSVFSRGQSSSIKSESFAQVQVPLFKSQMVGGYFPAFRQQFLSTSIITDKFI